MGKCQKCVWLLRFEFEPRPRFGTVWTRSVCWSSQPITLLWSNSKRVISLSDTSIFVCPSCQMNQKVKSHLTLCAISIAAINRYLSEWVSEWVSGVIQHQIGKQKEWIVFKQFGTLQLHKLKFRSFAEKASKFYIEVFLFSSFYRCLLLLLSLRNKLHHLSLSLLVVCCSVYNFISLSFIVVLSISFFVYYVHLYIRMHLLSFLYSSPTCLVSFTVTITGSPRYSFCVFQTFIYRRCPT